ncbi:calcium-binding protein [Psychrobacter sp.]|uniref:calcium-binding protein n=1 Tax=Psychrobacter sp. TaxID=56811 RepID=UPI0025CFB8F3|nr:calcium-binding protein [Psychrobacter sp.]
MGMFDYKNYSSDEASKLVEDTSKLAAYTNAYNFFNFIPGGDALNVLGTITGDLFANDINVSIPEGWKELTPTDFGVSADRVDNAGYFSIPSMYSGTALPGPQAKIFGQYNEAGDLIRVNFNVAGTNAITDVLDYLNLNSREGVELYEPILEMVRDFALDNGLKATDVVFSGYSLGASVTNVLAAERENLVDGFFTESDYIAHAVPTIYDNGDVVLNVGYENDVTHRITGNEPDFLSAIKAMDFGFGNPDKEFSSTTDNFVLYNDVYASPIWDISPFSFLNIPTGWYAHINGITTDAISRVIDSSFYEDTQQDSTVIVSDLSAINRGMIWVEDDAAPTSSSHFGTSAFLIGTEYGDKIAGGKNFDYIDAGRGNDIIKAGIGVDHIDGNTGVDEVRIEGRGKEWDVYQMQDDTLFFVDKDGFNLVEADNVESVSFNGEIASHINNYEITDTGLQDNRFLMKWFDNGDKDFLDHKEGSEVNDVIIGQTVFAREGNDTVTGTSKADILHAGRGDDVIMAMGGNDRVYGAEGDDKINGGAGNDTLIGGVGKDTFIFNALSGNDVIKDFNNDAGYKDILQFSSDLFSDVSALSSHTTQEGSNVSVAYGNHNLLTLENCTVDDVVSCAIVV